MVVPRVFVGKETRLVQLLPAGGLFRYVGSAAFRAGLVDRFPSRPYSEKAILSSELNVGGRGGTKTRDEVPGGKREKIGRKRKDAEWETRTGVFSEIDGGLRGGKYGLLLALAFSGRLLCGVFFCRVSSRPLMGLFGLKVCGPAWAGPKRLGGLGPHHHRGKKGPRGRFRGRTQPVGTRIYSGATAWLTGPAGQTCRFAPGGGPAFGLLQNAIHGHSGNESEGRRRLLRRN